MATVPTSTRSPAVHIPLESVDHAEALDAASASAAISQDPVIVDLAPQDFSKLELGKLVQETLNQQDSACVFSRETSPVRSPAEEVEADQKASAADAKSAGAYPRVRTYSLVVDPKTGMKTFTCSSQEKAASAGAHKVIFESLESMNEFAKDQVVPKK